MKHADHDAHRAFEDSVQAGCSGACEWGQDCTCSHSAWRAPRQPRKPEPRRPHLPLWTRVKLEWQRARARVVLSGVFLVSMLATLGATIATWLAR